MERVFGTLELRSVNDELREFEGIANTAALDDHGTVIEPSGARFSLPIPLLWFHDQETPVGEITHAELRNGAWHVKGSIRKVTEPGKVKDATDQAWHSLKYKLVRGLSIGFKSLKESGNRFIEWAWRELSLVTIPSNQEASILAVRSAFNAASGVPNTSSPGVSGTPSNNPRQKMPTIAEQITQHENSRAAKLAQRQAVFDKCGEEGRTPEPAEKETLDTLAREVESHDEYLKELYVQRSANVEKATPVTSAKSIEKASENRGGNRIVTVKSREEPGTGYARYVMAMVNGKGNPDLAEAYAKRTFGPDEAASVTQVRAELQMRAAVAVGNTTTSGWASQLVQTNYVNEILELLRPRTLIGRIPGVRRVPFNTSMPTQTGGGTYGWVGEGAPKPVTKPTYSSVSLTKAKIAGITVLTKELVKLSTPDAQIAVRDEMIAGIQQFMDGQLIDSTVAAGSNNPASITNGVTGTAATGTAITDAYSDIGARVAAFAAANYGLSGLVILMNESTAFILGLARDAAGNKVFPDIRLDGGSIMGIPVVTSETVGAQIILLHAPSLLVADEGGMEIDTSEEASVQLDSAPTNPADASTVLTSLWQHNLIGIRVERMITWGKARSTAVDRITGVAYVA